MVWLEFVICALLILFSGLMMTGICITGLMCRA